MTAAPPARAVVGDEGVRVPKDAGPVTVSFDGHYLWSFTPARDGRPGGAGGSVLVPWPPVLHRFLCGTTHAKVATVAGRTLFDGEVRLGVGEGDPAAGRIAVIDARTGRPLSVDKVGHLGLSFIDTDEGVREEMLAATDEALHDLREVAGVEAYLNYGALLGAIREGRMLGHDSDTDVCYLSEQTSPAEVIAESYAVERVMRARGWKTLRMSGGDVKLIRRLSDGRDAQIDIFVAFYVDGVFYQLGNRSGRLPREAIMPVSTVSLHGHDFPAPADPERMLAFLYGPQWRTPDPSFKYADPPAGVRRLDGWLRGFRTEMGAWTEFYKTEQWRAVPNKGSAFARWVEPRLPRGARVVDLGSGAGRDSGFFARKGFEPLGVDFSRAAVTITRQRLKGAGATEQLILGELRQVLDLGARLAREPSHLYARQLLGCLDAAATGQLWLLARMALRGTGGRFFAEFSANGPGLALPEPAPLVRRLDPAVVRAGIEASGGVVEHLEVGPGTDMTEGEDPRVCRLVAAWPATGSTDSSSADPSSSVEAP